MANRRGQQAQTSTTQPEPTGEGNVTTQEAPVTTDASTTTEANVESPATENTESTTAAADAEPDLTEFQAVVAAALEERDPTTGDLPEASLASVTAAYRKLDGLKAKNAAKKLVDEGMKNAMNSNDLPKARAHLQLSDKALVAQSKSGGEKAPADPTENFVQRVATLSLGYSLSVENVPEGVTDGWQDRVQTLAGESIEQARAYATWASADPESRGDEPEVSAVVRNAVKLAQGKAAKAGVSRGGGTFTGERRDIGVHILNAFEDKEVGDFLTVAQIRAVRSDEYGDNPPSAGAISARLFPKSGESSMVKVGIEPATEGGKKGARKIEVPGDES